MTRKRIGRLKTATDVRQYISRSIKKADRDGGDGAINNYYKLVMMASMLIKAIEIADLEQRLSKLEQAQKEQ